MLPHNPTRITSGRMKKKMHIFWSSGNRHWVVPQYLYPKHWFGPGPQIPGLHSAFCIFRIHTLLRGAPIYFYSNNKVNHLEVVTLLCCSPNLFPYLPLSILQSRSHYKFMKTETLGIEERGFGRIVAQDIALHQNVSLSLQNICFVPNSRCA